MTSGLRPSIFVTGLDRSRLAIGLFLPHLDREFGSQPVHVPAGLLPRAKAGPSTTPLRGSGRDDELFLVAQLPECAVLAAGFAQHGDWVRIASRPGVSDVM